jgi:hypothetical protein
MKLKKMFQILTNATSQMEQCVTKFVTTQWGDMCAPVGKDTNSLGTAITNVKVSWLNNTYAHLGFFFLQSKML